MRRRAVIGPAALLLLVAPFLAGCDSSIDRQRITTCRRTLPALVASDLPPRLLHVGRGSAPDSVRVDYALGQRQHRIDCLFDGGAGLIGVRMDHKAVSGGALFMLKKYYLETLDSEANDPVPAR
ncbi:MULTISPECIES: hypothetical protein [unclassified Methylobacterium]|jgi:hypothetical protein|uniref:hypothetical protein n=1 Tax=unclassified Methylobacterium TaxID=2615210 RepID=UPI0006FACB56|nr:MULTISPECIES: hypothetical protein [unclassified Methylobacterium]KQO50404.1 hypothetical protein ASF24_23270 [Methylobacterium sp. Leaf86]KQO91779.1 hypothetical protein ASF32_22160 [Methylobacterium sp. Leaf91]MBO1020156.1 hypothetical protein [Methylobacterium sp. SD274]